MEKSFDRRRILQTRDMKMKSFLVLWKIALSDQGWRIWFFNHINRGPNQKVMPAEKRVYVSFMHATENAKKILELWSRGCTRLKTLGSNIYFSNIV